MTATFSTVQLGHQLGNLRDYLNMCGSMLAEQATIKKVSRMNEEQKKAAYAATLVALDDQMMPMSTEGLQQQPVRALIQQRLRMQQVAFDKAGSSPKELLKLLEDNEPAKTSKTKKRKQTANEKADDTHETTDDRNKQTKGKKAKRAAQPVKKRAFRKTVRFERAKSTEEEDEEDTDAGTEEVAEVLAVRKGKGQTKYLVAWAESCLQVGEAPETWEQESRMQGVQGFEEAVEEYFAQTEEMLAGRQQENTDREPEREEVGPLGSAGTDDAEGAEQAADRVSEEDRLYKTLQTIAAGCKTLLTTQAKTEEMVQKLAVRQASSSKEGSTNTADKRYDFYGGAKVTTLKVMQRYEAMGHEEFETWFEREERDMKKPDSGDAFATEREEVQWELSMAVKEMRKVDREAKEEPSDEMHLAELRGAQKHVRRKWVRACEKMIVIHECWERVKTREQSEDRMRILWRDYKRSLYGTEEKAGILEMIKEAAKTEKERAARRTQAFLTEAMGSDKGEAKSRRQRRQPDDSEEDRREPRPRDSLHMTLTQVGMEERRKAEDVFTQCPDWLKGKYVTANKSGTFFGKNNLATSAVPGYRRTKPTPGTCRECGRSGHEAWECSREYTYNHRGRSLKCVPQAMLYEKGMVTDKGAVIK